MLNDYGDKEDSKFYNKYKERITSIQESEKNAEKRKEKANKKNQEAKANRIANSSRLSKLDEMSKRLAEFNKNKK